MTENPNQISAGGPIIRPLINLVPSLIRNQVIGSFSRHRLISNQTELIGVLNIRLWPGSDSA